MRRIEDYARYHHLRVSMDQSVAVVTFAPQHDGDIERSFFTELRDLLPHLASDRNVKAVVLTGSAGIFFGGVGRDRTIRLIEAGPTVVATQILTLQQIVGAILTFQKPLVAAVNGRALDIGGQIALLCDSAIASDTAIFGDTHVAKGLAAGDGGTMLWPLLVGMPRAREILLLGRPLTALEALSLHLVSEVVAESEVLPAATRLATRLGDLPRLAYIATRLAMNNWWRLSSILSWDLALAMEAASLSRPEYLAELRDRK